MHVQVVRLLYPPTSSMAPIQSHLTLLPGQCCPSCHPVAKLATDTQNLAKQQSNDDRDILSQLIIHLVVDSLRSSHWPFTQSHTSFGLSHDMRRELSTHTLIVSMHVCFMCQVREQTSCETEIFKPFLGVG